MPALVASAHGVVLELGPGTGTQLPRFTPSRITHIYGVEPNTAFAGVLATTLSERAPELKGRYTAIFSPVEDAAALAEYGVVAGSVDCVVSMQVLCSVARPHEVAPQLYELLRPGGEVIFWEHGKSRDSLTRWVQCKYCWWRRRARDADCFVSLLGLYNAVWPLAIGGCMLGRPVGDILLGGDEWETVDIHEDNDPISLLPRVWGRLVKRK